MHGKYFMLDCAGSLRLITLTHAYLILNNVITLKYSTCSHSQSTVRNEKYAFTQNQYKPMQTRYGLEEHLSIPQRESPLIRQSINLSVNISTELQEYNTMVRHTFNASPAPRSTSPLLFRQHVRDIMFSIFC